jgi:hypothetical protein
MPIVGIHLFGFEAFLKHFSEQDGGNFFAL